MGETVKKFKVDELKSYDGQNGRRAYVAYKGVVYDVTDSSFWIGGEHMGTHQAGRDLTDELEMAPHGAEMLSRMKIVGTLEL